VPPKASALAEGNGAAGNGSVPRQAQAWIGPAAGGRKRSLGMMIDYILPELLSFHGSWLGFGLIAVQLRVDGREPSGQRCSRQLDGKWCLPWADVVGRGGSLFL